MCRSGSVFVLTKYEQYTYCVVKYYVSGPSTCSTFEILLRICAFTTSSSEVTKSGSILQLVALFIYRNILMQYSTRTIF